MVAVLFTHFFSAVEVDSLFYEYFIEDRVYFNNHYGIKGVVNERFSGKWLAIVVSICKTIVIEEFLFAKFLID